MFCTRCGHPNKDDARFCANCGEVLKQDTTMSLNPVEAEDEGSEDLAHLQADLTPGQALLVIKRGPNAGSTFLMDVDSEGTTLGRNPASDLFLDDVTVSRAHAEVRRRADGFYIHDVGSLNGTYVNRERVDVTKLAAGDELQIGKFRVLFVPGEGS